MKEATLLMIKEEIEKEKEKIRRHNNDAKKVSELLNSEDVKEYFRLVDEEPTILEYKDDDEGNIIKNVFSRFIYKIDSSDTNGIFVYRGTYKVGDYCDIEHGPSDYIVGRNDPSATHRKYWDLEVYHAIDIPIKECDEFEKTHIIIFGKGAHYYKIRQEFITEVIEKGQAEAVKVIKKKYTRR